MQASVIILKSCIQSLQNHHLIKVFVEKIRISKITIKIYNKYFKQNQV